MIALIVLALSLFAVVASISQMIDNANAMKERTYASWIAQNTIAELRLSNEPPEVESLSEDVEFAGFEWTWRAIVSETGIENLYRVDVSVSYVGSDDVIRSVTGFIGERIPATRGSGVWSAPLPDQGVDGETR